ncbi:MAG: ABC transporter ATP-binding protein [Treponema sp.]|nr:ABC transporter ATP-binding protein [Treponema sp.]
MILKAVQINKKYPRPTKLASHFEAVKTTDFSLEKGKLTEITGRSGSGKSTLLYMMSGLLTPSAGNIFLDQTDIYSLSDEKLAKLRNKNFGVIPQGQTGLFALTVLQNVLCPAAIFGKTDKYQNRAMELLDMVGILNLKDAKMNELSGGEMRRMSIARALLMDPDFIFADEPTDDLDDENTEQVLKLLRKTCDNGKSVILVTHEQSAKKYADQIFNMDGGSFKS